MDYVCTDRPIDLAADYVVDVLREHLSRGERVLWLLTGGSGIPIAIQASQKLENINLTKLSVTLTDERFCPIGHKDENWQQLLNDGFSLPGATLYRPLIGADMQTTAERFDEWLTKQFKEADFTLGIFGLGSDGHTAGIKPHSPAITAESLATSYQGSDFDRVTISFNAIKQIDEAVVQASGNEKREVLHKLISETFPLAEQPAQILKEIPHVTIYSNNAKEEQ
jgi:6-phosphogluconolactonase/glucosamine-6-phosphate isomerase/deaminase